MGVLFPAKKLWGILGKMCLVKFADISAAVRVVIFSLRSTHCALRAALFALRSSRYAICGEKLLCVNSAARRGCHWRNGGKHMGEKYGFTFSDEIVGKQREQRSANIHKFNQINVPPYTLTIFFADKVHP